MTETSAVDSANKPKLRCGIRVLSSTGSKHLVSELQRIGLDRQQAETESDSLQYFVLKLERLSQGEAVSLKRGFASVHVRIAIRPGSAGDPSMIVAGTKQQFEELACIPGGSPPGEPAIFQNCLETIDNYTRGNFIVAYPGGRLDLSQKSVVMGVLNVTPDSFSDGGDFFSTKLAVKRVEELAEAGAGIIDIGGESTRPGSDPVSAEEEIRRVVPVIEAVCAKVSVPVSIDTHKPEVAHAALKVGAKMINDVAGLRENGKMGEVAAEHGVPVILMHMKGKPKTMQENPVYNDLIEEIYSSLEISVDKALAAGIGRDRIIIDPGIGFGKSFEDNLVVLDRLHEFKSLGVPICIGVSRKAFLGAVLRIPEPKNRLTGTISASMIAVREGAKIVRVHNVKETVEAVKVADAIVTGKLLQEA
jgi:dihydropteroate synthase